LVNKQVRILQALAVKISDHMQNLKYEDLPWNEPGPPLPVAADF
jgi:hypothetical protein